MKTGRKKKTSSPFFLEKKGAVMTMQRGNTRGKGIRGGAQGATGFSLIELLIVVAVILVIAAIAIPNYLRSRMLANETSAVQSLRTISTGETVYTTTFGVGFSPTLVSMGGAGGLPTAAGLIDDVLASGAKSGYVFTYVPNKIDALGHFGGFTINGDPMTPGATGDRYFFVDESYILRQSMTGPAVVTDRPI